MGNSKIKAIIFDLGNVVIDFNHMIAAERISKFTDKSGREIYDLFFDSELTGNFEEGKIPPAEFFLKIKKKLGLQIGYAEFVPIWNEIFFLSERNKKVYAIAKSLKKDYKLALLSNINVLHFEYIKQNFPVFDAFHEVVASCDLGIRKPHPLIYQKALDKLGSLPGETFYTDDRADLIECANKLGVKGFVFTDINQLERNLADSGVNFK
jgi:FMN phosphatase YigB (HAD superfamily)